MVSIVTGSGTGLVNTSKDVLGAAGELGEAATGRAGERVTVNAANGNVVVQDHDEFLVGVGSDVDLLRTYNSQGGWDGDNNDGWRIGYYRKVTAVTGGIQRIEADGTTRLYTASGGVYVNRDGGGQYDTLSLSGSVWTWTDGDSGVKETYVSVDGGTNFRLTQVTNPDGHVVKIDYDAGTGVITTIGTYKASSSTADETVRLNYSTSKQLTSITTTYQDPVAGTKQRSVISYTYYAAGTGAKAGKLNTATVDLTPLDGTDNTTQPDTLYTLTYGYDDTYGRLSSLTQTDGSQITIGYDSSGRVSSVSTTTAQGTRITGYTYSSGKTEIQEKLGTTVLQTSSLTYGSNNELREIAGAVAGGAGFKQSYDYNANGDLTQVTNASGESTVYAYDGTGGANGAWTRRTDAAGNVVERTFDSITKLLLTETVYSVADPDGVSPAQSASGGRTTRYVYANTAKRQLGYVVGPEGQVTRYTYNGLNQLQRLTTYTTGSFTGGTADLTSLTNWEATQATNANREVTEYTYDLRGQLWQETRYDTVTANATGVDLSGSASTQFTYDAFGHLLSRQDASGVKLSYEYDGLGRVTKATDTIGAQTLYTYDDKNRTTAVRLDNGQTTLQIFDKQGNLVTSAVLGATSATSTIVQQQTLYSYDALGRPWLVTDAAGVASLTLYDVGGRRSADIAANGQLTEYLYDGAGRLVQRMAYATLLNEAAIALLITADGQRSSKGVADVRPPSDTANDRVTTYYHDKAGRLHATLDADGYLVENAYDGASALLKETRYATVVTGEDLAAARYVAASGTTQATTRAKPAAASDIANDRVTRNIYDTSGRLAAQINGENALTVWTYDKAGNKLTQLRRSEVLSASEQLLSLANLKALPVRADDEFTQWVYDNAGRMIAQLDGEGALTEYTYDGAGRLRDTKQYLKQAFKPVVAADAVPLKLLTRSNLASTLSGLGTPLTTTRTYNSRGLLEYETAADGTKTFYQYDTLQRLKSVTRAVEQPAAEARTQVIDYDEWGRIKTTGMKDEAGITTTYDAAGRKASVTDARGYKTVYYYDGQGRQQYAILINPGNGGEVTETIYSSFSEVAVTVTHAKRLYEIGSVGIADAAAQTTQLGLLTGGSLNATLAGKVSALLNGATDQFNAVAYNRRGLIQQAIDALGFGFTTFYNAFGEQQIRVSDVGATPNARTLPTIAGYNRLGQRTALVRVDASTPLSFKSWGYDALGRLINETELLDAASARGIAYTYTRDTGTGRTVQVTETYSHDAGTGPTTVSAGTTFTTYDPVDRIVKRTDRAGNSVTYGYDAAARKMTMTTAEGLANGFSVITEYNRFGEVYKVTDGSNATTAYTYNNHGKLLTVTDALGNVTQNTYDLSDNLTQVTQGLKANGASAPIDDGSATTTTYSFDAADRVLTQTVDPGAGHAALQTRFEYDGQGRQIKITDPRGTVTTQVFNAKGELKDVIVDAGGLALKTSYTYDAQSRVLSVIEGAGTAAARKTAYEYDLLGQRTAEIVDPDVLKLKTGFGYDLGGRMVLKRNALDQVVARYRYDALGRMTYSVDAVGAVTRYTYDGEGRVVSVRAFSTALAAGWETKTDPELDTVLDALATLGGTPNDQIQNNAYDKDGRLIYSVDAQGYVTGRQYDKAGRVVLTRQYANPTSGITVGMLPGDIKTKLSADNAKDQLTRYTYDGAGRLRFTVDALGGVTETRYDRAGHVTAALSYAQLLVSTETGNDAGMGAVYALDRLSSDVAARADVAKDRVTQYAYDTAGRPRFAVDAEGYVTETRYDDANGRTTTLRYDNRISGSSAYAPPTFTPTLSSFTPALLASLGSATSVTRELDRAGRLAVETDGNNVQTRYTYDAANRVETEVRAANVSGQSSTTRYRYNAAGLRTDVIRGDGTAQASTTRYVYDPRGRLWKTIDPRGVALAEGAGEWEQAERERLGKARDLSTLSAEARTATQQELLARYTTETQYDNANRVKSITRQVSTASTLTTTALTTSTQYDAFGNAIKLTDARGYSSFQVFDKLGRVVQEIDAEKYLTVYTYDAFGNRLSSLRLDAAVQGAIVAGQAVTGTSSALDHTTTRQYDRNNRLLSETTAASDTEIYVEGAVGALNAFGERTNVRNKLGAIVNYTYDRLGRLLTETLPVTVKVAGVETKVVNEYQYDSRGNRVIAIEAKGFAEQRTTQMRYDGANRLTARIGMAYTALNTDNTTSTVTPADAYRYDARGNLVEQISHGQLQAGGNVTGGKSTVSYYDALDRQVLQVNTDRVATRSTYDQASNLVEQTTYATRLADSVVIDTGSAPSATKDAANDRTYTHRYDELGRKVESLLDQLYTWDSSLTVVVSGLIAQRTPLQKLFYDAVGNLTEAQNGRGHSSYSYYDGLGRKTFSVDAGGAAIAWDFGRAGGTATKETRYANFMPSGFAQRQSLTSTGAEALILRGVAGSNPDDRITEFTLDRLDRVTEKRILNVALDYVDETGKRTQSVATAITGYQYDGLGHVTKLVEQADKLEVSDIVYDQLGRETLRQGVEFKDWKGVFVRPTTETVYDALGNVVRRIQRGQTLSEDRTTFYGYDFNGVLNRVTDPNGAASTYEYDANGDLARRTNLLVQRSDGSKRNIVTRYTSLLDATGRAATEATFESDKVAATETRKTHFNAFGEVNAKGIGDGWEEFFEYSTLGKIVKTNTGDGAIKFYVYDAAGNQTREIRGNGDTLVNVKGMTLQQATESTQLYSRVSIYDKRNLVIQTIDPQIEVLKNLVTMSSQFDTAWVPVWSPSTGGIEHATMLPSAGIATSNGTIVISFGGANFWELAYSNSGLSGYGSGASGMLAINVNSYRGLGPQKLTYRASTSGSSYPYGRPIAMGRIQFTVDTSGNVNWESLPSQDGDRYVGSLTYSVTPTSSNGYASRSYSLTDGLGAVLQGSGIFDSPILEDNITLGQYRPTTGQKTLYLRVTQPWNGNYLTKTTTITIWADGKIETSESTDPTAMPVEFSIWGRKVPKADIELGGQWFRAVSGQYTAFPDGRPGYTTFRINARGVISSGQTYSYTLNTLTDAGAALVDEAGNPIKREGMAVVDGNGGIQLLQKVTVLNTGEKFSVKRLQEFNAFGEISEERDERVSTRMLAAINDDLKAKNQTLQTALTAGQQAAARTTLKYNTLGKLVLKLDPETFITRENGYRYRARPETRYGYDLLGRLTTVQDANGNLSRVQYLVGSRGDSAQVLQEFDAAGGNADAFDVTPGGIRKSGYDIFGDLREVTDAEGHITRYGYTKTGLVDELTRVNVRRYDSNGNLPTTGVDLKESYRYDELGQRIRVIDALSNQQSNPETAPSSTTDYDALGRVVRTQTAGGSITTYAYQLRQVSDAAISAMEGAWTGAKSGGYIKKTTGADNRVRTDEIEYFGHTTRHVDLGGTAFTYTYNSAGQLAQQTSTIRSGFTAGQNIRYSYYANGYIRSLRDDTNLVAADFAYDDAGNRVYEAYFQLSALAYDVYTDGPDKGMRKRIFGYQNSTIVYDELNRISRVTDPMYNIRYEFDAVGNRRLVDSVYWDGAAGLRDRQTYWYAYDKLNRFVVTKGQLSSTAAATENAEFNRNRFYNATRGTSFGDTSVTIIAGSDGIAIGYDKISQRRRADYTYNGVAVGETYVYSDDGYLQLTKQNDILKTSREIDALGRTTGQYDLANAQVTQSFYDRDNRLTKQVYADGRDARKGYRLEYTYYIGTSADSSDTGKGALAKTVLTPDAGGASTTTTTYTYDYWDSALQRYVTKQGGTGPGTLEIKYNSNGHIASSNDGVAQVFNTYFSTATGLVLQRNRTQNSISTQHYFYYADDHRIGDVSNTPDAIRRISYAEQLVQKGNGSKRSYYRSVMVSPTGGGTTGNPMVDYYTPKFGGASTADFDQNYEPINDEYPGSSSSNYVVRADGETLQGVAQSVWGDRAMWYLIAEANGLTAGADLKSGQLLVIPNKVTNIHNNASTWRPYNPGEAIGSTDPTVPTPPPPAAGKHGCGAVGQLIMVAVAVVATIYTAGAAAAYFAPAGTTLASGAALTASTFGTGMAALGGGLGWTGAAAAAVGGAVGSIASQGVGLLTGNVDKFSWKAVGQAALGSAITAGVGSALGKFLPLTGVSNTQSALNAAARAAIGAGANLALHGDWSWKTVGISAISAGIGAIVGSAVGGTSWAGGSNGIGQRLAGGLAGGLAARALTGGNRASYETLFASTLGNAIGESIAAQQQPASAPNSFERVNALVERARGTSFGTPNITSEQAAEIRTSLNLPEPPAGEIQPVLLADAGGWNRSDGYGLSGPILWRDKPGGKGWEEVRIEQLPRVVVEGRSSARRVLTMPAMEDSVSFLEAVDLSPLSGSAILQDLAPLPTLAMSVQSLNDAKAIEGTLNTTSEAIAAAWRGDWALAKAHWNYKPSPEADAAVWARAFPAPDPRFARIDAMTRSSFGSILYGASGWAGASQNTQDAWLAVGGLAEGIGGGMVGIRTPGRVPQQGPLARVRRTGIAQPLPPSGDVVGDYTPIKFQGPSMYALVPSNGGAGPLRWIKTENLRPSSSAHGNSLNNPNPTHIYVIRDENGVPWKIGESAQGLNFEGQSRRAEQQVRDLNRLYPDKYFESEIRSWQPDKSSGRTYETRLIERYRSLYGADLLPGNLTNR